MVFEGRLKWLMVLGAVLLGMVALVGCGPTQSTIKINEAEVAFEKATLVEAASKAPYEYFNASEHLRKAKEEWGFSDFEAALNYAILSREFAEKATVKAKGGKINLKDAKPNQKVVPGAPTLTLDKDADELDKIK